MPSALPQLSELEAEFLLIGNASWDHVPRPLSHSRPACRDWEAAKVGFSVHTPINPPSLCAGKKNVCSAQQHTLSGDIQLGCYSPFPCVHHQGRLGLGRLGSSGMESGVAPPMRSPEVSMTRRSPSLLAQRQASMVQGLRASPLLSRDGPRTPQPDLQPKSVSIHKRRAVDSFTKARQMASIRQSPDGQVCCHSDSAGFSLLNNAPSLHPALVVHTQSLCFRLVIYERTHTHIQTIIIFFLGGGEGTAAAIEASPLTRSVCQKEGELSPQHTA